MCDDTCESCVLPAETASLPRDVACELVADRALGCDVLRPVGERRCCCSRRGARGDGDVF